MPGRHAGGECVCVLGRGEGEGGGWQESRGFIQGWIALNTFNGSTLPPPPSSRTPLTPSSPNQRTQLQENPGWSALNTFNGLDIAQDTAINAEAASRQNVLRGRFAEHTAVYNNGDPTPIIPVVGMHVSVI